MKTLFAIALLALAACAPAPGRVRTRFQNPEGTTVAFLDVNGRCFALSAKGKKFVETQSSLCDQILDK